MAVINGIAAFIKAVPIIDKWFRNIAEAYYKLRVSQIENLKIGNQEKRAVIIRAIQKAENDQELTALSITLSDYNGGKL